MDKPLTATEIDELKASLSKLLPVSWDNELNGFGEPAHAVLTFADHATQAITMDPQTWEALNLLPRLLASARMGVDGATSEVDYEVWQDDTPVASSTALSDALHYLAVYGQEGPAHLVMVTRETLDGPAIRALQSRDPSHD